MGFGGRKREKSFQIRGDEFEAWISFVDVIVRQVNTFNQGNVGKYTLHIKRDHIIPLHGKPVHITKKCEVVSEATCSDGMCGWRRLLTNFARL